MRPPLGDLYEDAIEAAGEWMKIAEKAPPPEDRAHVIAMASTYAAIAQAIAPVLVSMREDFSER